MFIKKILYSLNSRFEEDEDVEEAFANGEHRSTYELPEVRLSNQKEKRLNKQVKDRLSQFGLSP